jgi:hypothetical protein
MTAINVIKYTVRLGNYNEIARLDCDSSNATNIHREYVVMKTRTRQAGALAVVAAAMALGGCAVQSHGNLRRDLPSV